MDMKIELVPIPVSDIDRAKAFYVDQVGFHDDHDITVNEDLRFVQLTPPGSACSIVLDLNMTPMAPGSLQGLQVVVDDSQAVHDELAAKGVPVEPVQDMPWGRFTFFTDPDGNRWSVQQLPEWSAATGS